MYPDTTIHISLVACRTLASKGHWHFEANHTQISNDILAGHCHRKNSLRLPTHWEGMDSLLNVATVAAPACINSCHRHPSAFVMCSLFFKPEIHWVEQPTYKRTISSTALPSDSPGSPKSAPLSLRIIAFAFNLVVTMTVFRQERGNNMLA